MGALQDKARKARSLATEVYGSVSLGDTKNLASKNAKAAGKKLTLSEEKRAAKIMQTRRQNDRDRTAARATFIAGPNSPRAKSKTKANVVAAVSGGAAKKVTPKAKQKTLNDFLKEGKRPPIKNKKIPSDADVIIKGYNDKKTLSKNKKKK
jgi:hypothetical protein